MTNSDIFRGEILGTGLLVLLGDGVVAGVLLNKSKAQNAGWAVITLGWGFAVMVGAYSSAAISGAHLNPGVTLGLWADGKVDAGKVPIYIIGQFIGAAIGATLVWLAYFPHWKETDDPAIKLGIFCTAPGIRDPIGNVICEIIGTFVLVFGIIAFGGFQAAQVSGLGVLLVAFLVVGIGMSLGGPTGYAINPARDLGPRIMHAVLPIPGKGGNDWEYAWVPVVGPVIGAIIAGLLARWGLLDIAKA